MQYSQKILSNNKQLFYAWFSAMFTRVDIIFCTDASRTDLKDIAQNISDQIAGIEIFANRFDSNSELSQLNANAYKNEVSVPEELFHIIAACQEYNKQTSGLFDISVNSLNGFRGGAAAVQLNAEKQSIRFLHPDVLLDLSGFIKGYALRTVRLTLKKEDINNALISMGNSSVLAIGNHPFGKGWKVSQPEDETNTGCVLFDECLTTSGNKADTTWPVLHPLSGKVVEAKKAVSVITGDPAEGEVLSTALYVAEDDQKAVLLKIFDCREMG
jgi:FAD:protein FMN transferase